MEHGHKYGELLVEPGYDAPGFKLRDEDGRYVSLRDFLDGRSVVLVFIRAVDDAHAYHILSDEDCSVLKKYQIYNDYDKPL